MRSMVTMESKEVNCYSYVAFELKVIVCLSLTNLLFIN